MLLQRALYSLLPLFLCGLVTSCQSDQPNEETPPHILFILTDDQGYGDLSLHGNEVLTTPNTDRLLKESARFNRFYVSPVCAPTRASFLSGQYNHRTGAFFVTRRAETMTDSVITIPEILATKGYRSGLFGKWHNGATYPYNPKGQGFDEFLGFTMGHYNSYYDYQLEDENSEEVPFRGYLTEVLTDSAYHFMRTTDQAGVPAFCMLTYQAPHTPVQAPSDLFDKYISMGVSEYDAGIYAMIEANDRSIGRLLDQLAADSILQRTIVIFSTDNGPNGDRYTAGLRGRKGQVDEGGVRVPFGIRLPGDHPANGRTIDQMAAHIDLLPTLAELTGTPLPANIQPLDGQSLVPLLEDTTDSWPDRRLFTFIQGYEFSPFPGAMRTQDQLYVLRAPGEHELYDLTVDPGQTSNQFDSTRQDHRQLTNEYLDFATSIPRPDLVAPPILLGDLRVPTIRLLAHEGEPFGKARFHDQWGWANDWAENMRDPNSGISWPVNVIREGGYQLELQYAVNGDKLPATIPVLIQWADQSFPITVPATPNQDLITYDLVPRKEVYPRDWEKARTRIDLPAGRYSLIIRPNSFLGEEAQLAVKAVVLRK